MRPARPSILLKQLLLLDAQNFAPSMTGRHEHGCGIIKTKKLSTEKWDITHQQTFLFCEISTSYSAFTRNGSNTENPINWKSKCGLPNSDIR